MSPNPITQWLTVQPVQLDNIINEITVSIALIVVIQRFVLKNDNWAKILDADRGRKRGVVGVIMRWYIYFTESKRDRTQHSDSSEANILGVSKSLDWLYVFGFNRKF